MRTKIQEAISAINDYQSMSKDSDALLLSALHNLMLFQFIQRCRTFIGTHDDWKLPDDSFWRWGNDFWNASFLENLFPDEAVKLFIKSVHGLS